MRNFVPGDRNQPYLLPPDLRDWLPEDDLAHFVIGAVERVPLSHFVVNVRGTGSAQYHPRVMLALLIYCYANGIFSSRRIERATYRFLDPFCGRGNGPFAATVIGRDAIGIDVNPIAWLFAAAKLQPAPAPEQVTVRLSEIAKACRPRDRRSNSRFETMAWAPAVRALLKAARRELDWRNSIIDRTLMAFITLHMQDELGCGLSNVMSPTIAYSPTYAVKWWTKKGFLQPPDIEPVAVLGDKIHRRYQYGVPKQATGTVLLGDSRLKLPQQNPADAALLVTSPPYCGVTDYWNDHWIRLWMLGYPFRKNWTKSARFQNQKEYKELISRVFQESKRHLKSGAAILVRSDQRRSTARMCVDAMKKVWPRRQLLVRNTTAPHPGISNHHGRGGRKAKEIDLLMPGSRASGWYQHQAFIPYGEMN